MVFTRKDGDFHGRTVSFRVGISRNKMHRCGMAFLRHDFPCIFRHRLSKVDSKLHIQDGEVLVFFPQKKRCWFLTLPKFNSEFTPEKLPKPNRNVVVFQPPFFRGELLNFGGVFSQWLTGLNFWEWRIFSRKNMEKYSLNFYFMVLWVSKILEIDC